MNGLYDIPSHLSGAPLLAALVAMGLTVGFLTGLFGIGGAFIITPLLNVLLGIPYGLAVGSSLSFTIGTGASGAARHSRLGSLDVRSVLWIACGSVLGTAVGAYLNKALSQGLGRQHFELSMHTMFIVLLSGTALVVWRGPRQKASGLSPLQRLPLRPRIDLPGAGLTGLSLPGMLAIGLCVGVITGLLGIGGGVLYMPLLLLVVGIGIHKAIGTSLGVVLVSGIVGTVLYGARGEASLWIVMPLLAGSSIGVQSGAAMAHRMRAAHLQRYFALLVALVAMVVGIDFVRKIL